MKDEKHQMTAPQGWDDAQQNTAPKNVQYVVMQKSVQGVGGWLTFFVVMFALGALGHISNFFMSLLAAIQSGAPSGSDILILIFSLPLAALYIATIVFILQQKRLGQLFAWISFGAVAVYMIINSLVDLANTSDVALAITTTVSGIMTAIVSMGLLSLYFALSKRVKATLIN